MGETYVIWSNEHRGWWGPNKFGYTPDLRNAGRYSRFEAMQVCAATTLHSIAHQPPGVMGGKIPSELAMTESDALDSCKRMQQMYYSNDGTQG